MSWPWSCSCIEHREFGAEWNSPKGCCLAPSMCCPEGSFLDTMQFHELVPLLIYLFLPVFEMKAQFHLLSKKGSGFPLVVPVGVSWNQGCDCSADKNGYTGIVSSMLVSILQSLMAPYGVLTLSRRDVCLSPVWLGLLFHSLLGLWRSHALD